MDIYGIGVLLYELFAGYAKVIDRKSIFEEYLALEENEKQGFPVKKRNTTLSDLSSNIPPEINHFVMKVLFENADGEKFSSMEELLLELNVLLKILGSKKTKQELSEILLEEGKTKCP